MDFENDEEDSLRAEARDKEFFSLILELSEKNSSRYESQARVLLKKRTIKVSVEGIDIQYKITPVGCSSATSRNLKGISTESWSRMGWRKSSKMKALPMFFAGTEAGVLMDLSE